jgi:hypothetical protein
MRETGMEMHRNIEFGFNAATEITCVCPSSTGMFRLGYCFKNPEIDKFCDPIIPK